MHARKILTSLICLALFSLTVSMASGQMMPDMTGRGHWLDSEKNPSVAALLSLQPMPLALGNFYADDWAKGILYTTVEVGLVIPSIVLLSDRFMNHMDHMNHHHEGSEESHGESGESWTDAERVWFISLVTGYILTKVMSAYDAASSVEKQRRREQRVSTQIMEQTSGVLLRASITF